MKHRKNLRGNSTYDEVYDLFTLPVMIVLFVPMAVVMLVVCRLNKGNCESCRFRGTFWDTFFKA